MDLWKQIFPVSSGEDKDTRSGYNPAGLESRKGLRGKEMQRQSQRWEEHSCEQRNM